MIAVCDATSLERSLILALQVLELTDRAFVCVNLMDEAQKQGIRLDLAALSFELGVPVVAVSAGREEGMQELLEQLRRILDGFEEPRPRRLGVIDASVRGTQAAVLALQGGSEQASDAIASRFVRRAEEIAGRVVCEENEKAKARTVRADRMLTGRFTGGLLLGASFSKEAQPAAARSPFAGWSFEEKLSLLNTLKEQGADASAIPDLSCRTEQEADEALTAALERLCPAPAVSPRALGAFSDSWGLEEKARYSQMLLANGLESQAAEINLLPYRTPY